MADSTKKPQPGRRRTRTLRRQTASPDGPRSRDWLRAFLIGGGARGCQFDRLLLAVPLERPIGCRRRSAPRRPRSTSSREHVHLVHVERGDAGLDDRLHPTHIHRGGAESRREIGRPGAGGAAHRIEQRPNDARNVCLPGGRNASAVGAVFAPALGTAPRGLTTSAPLGARRFGPSTAAFHLGPGRVPSSGARRELPSSGLQRHGSCMAAVHAAT